MARYIDADKIEYDSNINYHGTDYKMTSEIYINNMPTEDVKPIVRSEWISKDISDFVYCSNCDYKEWYSNVNNYCPNCGAIMRNVHCYHMKRWVY